MRRAEARLEILRALELDPRASVGLFFERSHGRSSDPPAKEANDRAAMLAGVMLLGMSTLQK